MENKCKMYCYLARDTILYAVCICVYLNIFTACNFLERIKLPYGWQKLQLKYFSALWTMFFANLYNFRSLLYNVRQDFKLGLIGTFFITLDWKVVLIKVIKCICNNIPYILRCFSIHWNRHPNKYPLEHFRFYNLSFSHQIRTTYKMQL